jgi:hypothetical protein
MSGPGHGAADGRGRQASRRGTGTRTRGCPTRTWPPSRSSASATPARSRRPPPPPPPPLPLMARSRPPFRRWRRRRRRAGRLRGRGRGTGRRRWSRSSRGRGRGGGSAAGRFSEPSACPPSSWRADRPRRSGTWRRLGCQRTGLRVLGPQPLEAAGDSEAAGLQGDVAGWGIVDGRGRERVGEESLSCPCVLARFGRVYPRQPVRGGPNAPPPPPPPYRSLSRRCTAGRAKINQSGQRRNRRICPNRAGRVETPNRPDGLGGSMEMGARAMRAPARASRRRVCGSALLVRASRARLRLGCAQGPFRRRAQACESAAKPRARARPASFRAGRALAADVCFFGTLGGEGGGGVGTHHHVNLKGLAG